MTNDVCVTSISRKILQNFNDVTILVDPSSYADRLKNRQPTDMTGNNILGCLHLLNINVHISSLCTIVTILLTFLGKSCNAHMLHGSGVYYSYMVSWPHFEFRKGLRNFWHQDACF